MQHRKITNIEVKRSSTDWERNMTRTKLIFVDIADGYVYLSYTKGRTYWVLRNFRRLNKPLPKIKLSDRTKTLWINSFGIRFFAEKDYKFAKKCVNKYIK